MNTVEKLEVVFREALRLPEDFVIEDNMAPGKTAGWDSLGNTELIVLIEEEFSIQFEFDELMLIEDWKSLKETVICKVGK